MAPTSPIPKRSKHKAEDGDSQPQPLNKTIAHASPNPKRSKGKVDGGDLQTKTKSSLASIDDEPENGIAWKLEKLQKEIETKEGEIKTKKKEVEAKKEEVNEKKREVESLKESMLLVGQQGDLIELMSEKDKLVTEESELRKKYSGGHYYAATYEYWKEEAHVNKSTSCFHMFQRSTTPDDVFKCRCAKNNALGTSDEYTLTKQRCQTDALVAPEKSTRTSTSSQSKQMIRDRIWPTDIFGRPDPGGHIAHLLPAGPKDGKQWSRVAGAVVGINHNDEAMEKARCGVLVGKSRLHGTGVVHFVSNKLRLHDQGTLMDGKEPKMLIVPVMKVEEALNWRGQGYSAVVFTGKPLGPVQLDNSDAAEAAENYKKAHVHDNFHLTNKCTRDAKTKEIETARSLLHKSVMALMELKKGAVGGNEVEKGKECSVPASIDAANDRRPVCLVRFGSHDAYEEHPAPDPLLLALRAANIWALLVRFPLLANGLSEEDCISEGDMIAEEAYFEAKFGSSRELSWAELAQRLGQPNGYVG